MKKSLLALAVLGAFAGAASAQSSVTIYGLIDAGVTRANDGNSNNPGRGNPDQWNVQQGAASRLGFRGVEDLGGGLNAFFQFEHRFNSDTGSINNSQAFWHARSKVGLGGGFGSVYLGREYIPAFWVSIAADPYGFDTVGQLGQRYTMANYFAADSASRNNNVVGYQTPTNLGGFSAELQVSAGEGLRGEGTASIPDDPADPVPANARTDVLGRAFGANVMYKAGPISAGLAFDMTKNNTAGDDPRVIVLSGGYDFGFAKLLASFANSRVVDRATGLDTTKAKSVTIAGAMPLGAGQLRVAGGLLRTDPAGGGDDVDGKKFSVGYHYSLSKRTTLYTDLGTAKDDGADRSTAFDVGVKHSF